MINVKIRTSELQGVALDYAVAKAQGRAEIEVFGRNRPTDRGFINVRFNPHPKASTARFDPSENWEYGGPIIESESLWVRESAVAGPAVAHLKWFAYASRQYDGDRSCYYGETFLIAAMRCFVASKLGSVVEVPEVLV